MQWSCFFCKNVLSLALILAMCAPILYAQADQKIVRATTPGGSFQVKSTSGTWENYFPIGWMDERRYREHKLATMEETVNGQGPLDPETGLTVLTTNLFEAHSLYQKAHGLSGWSYTTANLTTALVWLLDDLEDIGMKVILEVEQALVVNGQVVYEPLSIAANIASNPQVHNHPGLFAWYIADEPESDNIPDPATLAQWAQAFRDNDPTHPVFIVSIYPIQYESPEGYSLDSYNFAATDPYVITSRQDRGYSLDWSDYNWSAMYADFMKVHHNPGFIHIVGAQDDYTHSGHRRHTYDEMFYNSISPLVRGARGLMYWSIMRGPHTNQPVVISHNNVQKCDNIMRFLTRDDNPAGVRLTNVLMEGEDRSHLLEYGDIAIDDQNVISVSGSTITLTTASFKSTYRSHNFNTGEPTGNVYRLDNGDWIECSNGIGTTARTAWELALHNGQVISAHQHRQVYNTQVGSCSWTAYNISHTTFSMFSLLSHPVSGQNELFSGGNKNQVYKFDGQTWVPQNDATDIHGQINAMLSIDHDNSPTTANVMYIGTDGADGESSIYYSFDHGQSWNAIDNDFIIRDIVNHERSEHIWSLAADGTTLYAGTNGQVFRFEVSGAHPEGNNWTTATIELDDDGGPISVWSLVIDPGNTSTLVAGTNEGFYRSTDAGLSWTRANGFPVETHAWDVAVNPLNNDFYGATDIGVYRSTDAGATWTNTTNNDLQARYDETTRHIACRSIAVDAGGNVYAGSLEYENSYINQNPGLLNTNNTTNFELFASLILKHQGSYYLWSCNDFRNRITLDFKLDAVLDDSETVYQIVEVDLEGSNYVERQVDFEHGSTFDNCYFTAEFGAYEPKIFRIDVMHWTDTKTVAGHQGWVTAGAGLSFGDFDNPGSPSTPGMPDLAIMTVNDAVGHNSLRFSILWDVVKNGDDVLYATANVDYVADGMTTTIGYGEVTGAIGWSTSGGGAETGELHGSGFHPELLLMAIDDPLPGNNEFRMRVAGDVRRSGSVVNYDVTTVSCALNNASVLTAEDETTGGGLAALYPTNGLYNDPIPELYFTDMENVTSGPNTNHYRSLTNADCNGDTPGCAQSTAQDLGWLTAGGGSDIVDIDNDGTPEMILMGIELQNSSPLAEARFMIKNIDGASSCKLESVDRPWFYVPLCSTPEAHEDITWGGVAFTDIDGDGDQDMAVLGVIDQPTNGHADFCLRFGINGLISSSVEAYGKQSAEPQPEQNRALPLHSALMQNRPNPFSGTTQIDYTLAQDAQVRIEVLSMLGEVLLSPVDGFRQRGEHRISIDAGTLESGTYLYRLILNGRLVHSKTMVVVK